MKFKELLYTNANTLGIFLSDAELEKFERYFNLLIEWNKKINLTAITDEEGVINKHFIDCLLIFKHAQIPENAKIIDIGSGAGFPGVVMKIYRNDIKLTLLDSLNKRIVFLNEIGKELNIDYETVHMRAEEGAKNDRYREKYDIAVSRAVAQMNILSEYCLPYVRTRGSFYAMKGPQITEESERARKAITQLGGGEIVISNYKLPNGDLRSLATVKKIMSTPAIYPRTAAKIKAKPL